MALLALVALVVLLATAAVPSAAAAKATDLVVHGTIALPTTATNSSAGTRCTYPVVAPSAEWVISGVTPGKYFALTADAGSWRNDFDVAFFGPEARCNGTIPVRPLRGHRNFAGDEHATVPDGAVVAVVTMPFGTPGAAFTYREFSPDRVRFSHHDRRKPTVIAIIEPQGSGFSPYHFDFAGHRHPWNLDEELENDLDFGADPATYLPGYPGYSEPVALTVPQAADEHIGNLGGPTDRDKAAWDSMLPSTPSTPRLYRFPGTKVVGTVKFAQDGDEAGTKGSTYPDPNLEVAKRPHGTQAASVAAGNIHGTCPECVLVLLNGDTQVANAWAAQQPWIDVVSNSYGVESNLPNPFDAAALQRAAVERGQTWVWSSGNGVRNAGLVPTASYTSATKGGDWIVTVGGVTSTNEQAGGSTFPVDIASYSDTYPSAGGPSASGTSHFGGTSNAAPVVAGSIAKTIQLGRDLLGDATPGHKDGVVAEGKAFACVVIADCPLADGKLTRAEAQAVVFGSVLPAPPRPSPPGPPINTVGLNAFESAAPVPTFMRQGHGVVHGRMHPARFVAEQRRFLDVVRGAVPPFERPPGEREWMVADSKLRQSLWGAWDGGYFRGDPPPLVEDPLKDGIFPPLFRPLQGGE